MHRLPTDYGERCDDCNAPAIYVTTTDPESAPPPEYLCQQHGNARRAGTYAPARHHDCGERFNMHAGCALCCPCLECGEERAARLRRAELDRELAAMEARGEARVIRVDSLGAALEAQDEGPALVRLTTHKAVYAREHFNRGHLPNSDHARAAARLARRALGSAGECSQPDCIREAGHPGRHLYAGAGEHCPGLSWRASDLPHPADCAHPSTDGARDVRRALGEVRA